MSLFGSATKGLLFFIHGVPETTAAHTCSSLTACWVGHTVLILVVSWFQVHPGCCKLLYGSQYSIANVDCNACSLVMSNEPSVTLQFQQAAANTACQPL